MTGILGRLADRALSRLVPTVDAAAGCSYEIVACGCSGGLRKGKKCMYGCSGVPNHCYPCNITIGTC